MPVGAICLKWLKKSQFALIEMVRMGVGGVRMSTVRACQGQLLVESDS